MFHQGTDHRRGVGGPSAKAGGDWNVFMEAERRPCRPGGMAGQQPGGAERKIIRNRAAIGGKGSFHLQGKIIPLLHLDPVPEARESGEAFYLMIAAGVSSQHMEIKIQLGWSVSGGRFRISAHWRQPVQQAVPRRSSQIEVSVLCCA